MYVFSYFKEEQESLFLAVSEDGYQWRELNGGHAIFASHIGSKRLRDPFIWEDREGTFHLIWTDGWRSRSIGYARSSDLIHWEDEQLLPVMEQIPETQNTWAPEIFYDTAAGRCRIIWSSTVGTGPRNHRIWSATTADFKSFTDSSLLWMVSVNNTTSAFDLTIWRLGNRLVMKCSCPVERVMVR